MGYSRVPRKKFHFLLLSAYIVLLIYFFLNQPKAVTATNSYLTQSQYQKAILFAARKHNAQHIPGTDLPYLLHLSNVAMEILTAARHDPDFDITFAITLALLHDTLEDTSTSFEELEIHFGHEVATAVAALTKDPKLPKTERMAKIIATIKQLPKEVLMAKMADRITNLQKPPAHWSNKKRYDYWKEAKFIYEQLHTANDYLATRLHHQMEKYAQYFKLPDLKDLNK